MLVKEFLHKIYKPKKNGDLPKIAISFMVKHDLKENDDLSEKELIILAQHLSSKEKRIAIITELLNGMVAENKSNMGSWRKKTYKQIAREVHPDSQTGDTESFQFLQEIKEFLWDYNGEPRKEIHYAKWSVEKEYHSKPYNRYEKYRKKQED